MMHRTEMVNGSRWAAGAAVGGEPPPPHGRWWWCAVMGRSVHAKPQIHAPPMPLGCGALSGSKGQTVLFPPRSMTGAVATAVADVLAALLPPSLAPLVSSSAHSDVATAVDGLLAQYLTDALQLQIRGAAGLIVNVTEDAVHGALGAVANAAVVERVANATARASLWAQALINETIGIRV